MKSILTVLLLAVVMNAPASALITEVYYSDGIPHVIDTDRSSDRFWIDWQRSDPWEPPTELDVISGGEFAEVRAGGNSTVTVNGGVMYGEQIILSDNAELTLLSGSIKNGMTAGPGTTVNIKGGLIETHFTSTFNTSGTLYMNAGEIDHLFFHDSAIGDISGGRINELISVEDNGQISLEGIFDQGYTTITHDPANGSLTTGVISGVLSDNTPVSITYLLRDQGQITLIPEPVSVVVLMVGLVGMSRRR